VNAITISGASLHAALAQLEATGRLHGTAAYAGGLATLRALLAPAAEQAATPIASITDQVRAAFEREDGGTPARMLRGTAHGTMIVSAADQASLASASPAGHMAAGANEPAQRSASVNDAEPRVLKAGSRLRCVDASPIASGHPAPVVRGSEYVVERTFNGFVALEGIPLALQASRFVFADEGPQAPRTPADDAAEPPQPAPSPSPPPVSAQGAAPIAAEPDAAVDNGVQQATGQLTPERAAAFPALWRDPSLTNPKIRERLNALPGAFIANDPGLYRIAQKLGLPKRSELFDRSAPASTEPAAATPEEAAPAIEPAPTTTAPAPVEIPPAQVPAPQPPPLAAAPAARPALGAIPIPPTLSSPDDIKADAFKAFDNGLSVRDIAAEFGEPIARVSAWQHEWRLARKQQPAASA
jgi:hypothetical protein